MGRKFGIVETMRSQGRKGSHMSIPGLTDNNWGGEAVSSNVQDLMDAGYMM